jgi:hypothetical protein
MHNKSIHPSPSHTIQPSILNPAQAVKLLLRLPPPIPILIPIPIPPLPLSVIISSSIPSPTPPPALKVNFPTADGAFSVSRAIQQAAMMARIHCCCCCSCGLRPDDESCWGRVAIGIRVGSGAFACACAGRREDLRSRPPHNIVGAGFVDSAPAPPAAFPSVTALLCCC